jgi:hypothetical protein
LILKNTSSRVVLLREGAQNGLRRSSRCKRPRTGSLRFWRVPGGWWDKRPLTHLHRHCRSDASSHARRLGDRTDNATRTRGTRYTGTAHENHNDCGHAGRRHQLLVAVRRCRTTWFRPAFGALRRGPRSELPHLRQHYRRRTLLHRWTIPVNCR